MLQHGKYHAQYGRLLTLLQGEDRQRTDGTQAGLQPPHPRLLLSVIWFLFHWCCLGPAAETNTLTFCAPLVHTRLPPGAAAHMHLPVFDIQASGRSEIEENPLLM